MGFQPGLGPNTFLLLTDNRVFPIQIVDNVLKMHPTKAIVRQKEGGTMWAVREIAEETIAVGFFDRADLEIYYNGTLQTTINLGMRLFGMILPPISPPSDTPQDEERADWPKYLIALDNSAYKVIDLMSEEGSEGRIRELASIRTGIGGYMPRYISQVIDGGQSFSMTTICQNGPGTSHYLAHFVLNERCEPANAAHQIED